MQNQLQKAINLAKKTGDRLIVYDMSENNEAYVVMSLEDYEKLATGQNEVKSLTEDELLDKINRDIAVWKNGQYNKEEASEIKPEPVDNYDFANNEFLSENIEEDMSDEDDYEYSEKNQPRKNHWGIPNERKVAADEIIDEDTQYLEEVKF